MAKIDLTTLSKALKQLEFSLKYSESETAKNDQDLFVQFRMAAIQAFEFSYELTIKILHKYLKEFVVEDDIYKKVHREVIRIAAERGLIDNPKEWFSFREMRNKTSHAYDDKIADEVFAQTPAFLSAARDLSERLKKLEKGEL